MTVAGLARRQVPYSQVKSQSNIFQGAKIARYRLGVASLLIAYPSSPLTRLSPYDPQPYRARTALPCVRALRSDISFHPARISLLLMTGCDKFLKKSGSVGTTIPIA